MGLQSHSGYDLGFLFMAFSPEMFSSKEKFEMEVEQLIHEVKNSRKETKAIEIYFPGEQSMERIAAAKKKGSIEISHTTWQKLLAFAQGKDVKGDEGLIE